MEEPRGMNSSLGRVAAVPATSTAEMDELRRRSWAANGVAVIDVAALRDPTERSIVTRIANRLFGPRRQR